MRVIHRGDVAILTTVTAALLAMALILTLAPSVHAVTPFSESYLSTTDLPLGSIVALKKNSTDTIEAATIDTADNVFGVTISSSGSLLTISSTKGSEVQVATQGNEEVLVSDINGAIKQGDPITASPIAGVGMKATDNVRIVGTAQADMTGGSKQQYKTKSETKDIIVGAIPVLVNISYFYKQPDKTIVPAAIQQIANGIAGKKVDPIPIIISGVIFAIMMIVVMGIIYTMIRSSIISVGRNPMSQSAVYRGVMQLSALVLVILSVGLGSMYLVLAKL